MLRNLLWTQISCNKAERAEPLRTENGSRKLNSRDPNETFVDSGIAGKPCELNLWIEKNPATS